MARAKKWHEKLFGPLFVLNTPTNGDVIVRVSCKIPEFKTVIGAPKEPGIHISVRRTDGDGQPIGKDGKGRNIVPGYSMSETLEVARLLEEKNKDGKTRRARLLTALKEAQDWWKEQPSESTPKGSRLEEARGSNPVQTGPSQSDIQDMIAQAVAAALSQQGQQQQSQDTTSETSESQVEEVQS